MVLKSNIITVGYVVGTWIAKWAMHAMPWISLISCFKPDAVQPVATATKEMLRDCCFSGLGPEIQATRIAGGHWLQ